MNAGGQMHDDVGTGKRSRPIRPAIDRAHGDESRPRRAAHRPILHLPPGKLGTKRPSDKARRTGDQDHASIASIRSSVRFVGHALHRTSAENKPEEF